MIYCLRFNCRHEAIVIRLCKQRTTFICVCQCAPAAAHEYTRHVLHLYQLEHSGRKFKPQGLVEQFHVFATRIIKFDFLTN